MIDDVDVQRVIESVKKNILRIETLIHSGNIPEVSVLVKKIKQNAHHLEKFCETRSRNFSSVD